LETNIDEEEEAEKSMKKISDNCCDDNIIIIIVPIRIGALGTTMKGLDQDLQLLPGHPSSVDLQIITMSTAHTIRKVLR
jgi:hypothetical protein